MTNDEACALMQRSGYRNSFIEKCFSPLSEGWQVSALLDTSTLRIEHSDGSLTSEYAVDLESGKWALFDVGSDFYQIDGGDEHLTKPEQALE
jgi:hypothetical protein